MSDKTQQPRNKVGAYFRRLFTKHGMIEFVKDKALLIALIIMMAVITIRDPNFISGNSLLSILVQSSTKIIIALGISLVLLTGGVDLSAGRMVGIAAVIAASMLQNPGYSARFFPNLPALPVILPILLAILAVVIFGALNGILVSRFHIPPFIATLGTMIIVYGINSLYFNMEPNRSQPIGGLRSDFTTLGTGDILGIPIVVIFALVAIVGIWVLLNRTVLGKNIYAVGGNKEAALVSGINVMLTLILVYVIAASMYGLGGILEAARTGGATNNYGDGYELDAIAACVVGGVSTTGGVGKVSGIVIGALLLTIITYGLTFIGVDPQWQFVIKGLIIVVAVGFDIRKYIMKK